MPPQAHPTALLLFTHLSLLPLPSPPTSITSPPPLSLTAPTSSRTHLRDHLLFALSSLLAGHPPLQNTTLPTPAENSAFVNGAVAYLERLRREEGGWWWAELGGTVRKSDLAEACGGRYEQMLLALSCEVVWSEITRLVASSRQGAFVDLPLPKSAQELTESIPRLLRTYQGLVKVSLEFQAQADALAKHFEHGWEALGERKDTMESTPTDTEAKVSLDRLAAILTSKEEAWIQLVEQWLDMERVEHGGRLGFDGAVAIVDRTGPGSDQGSAVGATGPVSRLQMANAMERTRSIPDAALLLQEHLAVLPALTATLETRLAKAEDAVVNRDGSQRPSKVAQGSETSEQLSFWREQARANGRKDALQDEKVGKPRTGVATSVPTSSPHALTHPLLDLTNLAPPRLSAADRARQLLASLRTPSISTTHDRLPRAPVRAPSPPPTPRAFAPARYPPASPRRTPRKFGRQSSAIDLRRQVLASARKKAPLMGRTPAKMAATPRLGKIGRFVPKADDGWEETGEGESLTLEEMQAAQTDGRGWDGSFL